MALVYNESTGEFEERRVNPDMEFIKNQFKRIEKNKFFWYITITNTLIGNASLAKSVKPLWLDNPQKYIFKTQNLKQPHRYSIDGGITFTDFPYDTATDSLENAVEYTYRLFSAMGLMTLFREKGKIAIDYMVDNECLKYH